jgi:hypothetical protein
MLISFDEIIYILRQTSQSGLKTLVCSPRPFGPRLFRSRDLFGKHLIVCARDRGRLLRGRLLLVSLRAGFIPFGVSWYHSCHDVLYVCFLDRVELC